MHRGMSIQQQISIREEIQSQEESLDTTHTRQVKRSCRFSEEASKSSYWPTDMVPARPYSTCLQTQISELRRQVNKQKPETKH